MPRQHGRAVVLGAGGGELQTAQALGAPAHHSSADEGRAQMHAYAAHMPYLQENARANSYAGRAADGCCRSNAIGCKQASMAASHCALQCGPHSCEICATDAHTRTVRHTSPGPRCAVPRAGARPPGQHGRRRPRAHARGAGRHGPLAHTRHAGARPPGLRCARQRPRFGTEQPGSCLARLTAQGVLYRTGHALPHRARSATQGMKKNTGQDLLCRCLLCTSVSGAVCLFYHEAVRSIS